MGWYLRRQLRQNAARLASLRAELGRLDEQVEVFVADAEDHQIRAMVAETTDAERVANDSRKHAATFQRYRQRVRDEIAQREARQDELLDKMTR